MPEFCNEDCGLNGVQPPIDPDVFMLVSSLLPVIPQAMYPFGDRLIVRKDHPPVSITSQRLGGKKRRGPDIRKSAGPLPLVGCPKGLAAIFNDKETMPLCNTPYPVHIRHLTVEADRDNPFCPSCDLIFYERRVDIVRLLIDIHKNRSRPKQGDDPSGRHKGEWGA